LVCIGLLVEDEESVMRITRSVLVAQGYEVLPARSGAEALKIAQEHPGRIDLLLTDVVMPGAGGPDIAARLKATRTELKVLFMSGYPARSLAQERGLDPGVPYLQKPFTPAGLAERVRDVLDA
jgi:hypothetical protein